jgi:hypothetical protein
VIYRSRSSVGCLFNSSQFLVTYSRSSLVPQSDGRTNLAPYNKRHVLMLKTKSLGKKVDKAMRILRLTRIPGELHKVAILTPPASGCMADDAAWLCAAPTPISRLDNWVTTSTLQNRSVLQVGIAGLGSALGVAKPTSTI